MENQFGNLPALFCRFHFSHQVKCSSSDDIKAEFDNFAQSTEAESAESEDEAKSATKKSLKLEGKKSSKKRKRVLKYGPTKTGHVKLQRVGISKKNIFARETIR